ncbi:Serpin peptidase inhibitor, clade B (Ovalbumin), member [Chamberlinius hualienensis]
MSSIKILFIAVLIVPMLVNSQKCSIAPQDKRSVTKLSKGHLAFSLNTYKAMGSENNLVYSPFSLGIALAMTAAGAGGNTLKQMKDILHLNELGDETKINQAFLSVLDSICSNPNYSFSTANRMYLQNHFQILQDYMNILKNDYKASAENVDFEKNSDGVAQTINQWVENETNRTIKNLFPPGSIAPETLMILVNAIYFKGIWKKKFESVKTKEGNFKLANEQTQTVPVSMMNLESRFKYGKSEELKSKILKMDYAGDRLAMYIILPDEVKGLSTLQQQLTPELLTNMRQQMTETNVIVVIPKLKLNFKKKMVDVLKNLGMTDLFDSVTADLSKISTGKLMVSDVVHQAYVEVDEEGTTAAAATGISFVPTSAIISPPDTENFIADHPFMLIIHDALNDLILFMGHVTNPKS